MRFVYKENTLNIGIGVSRSEMLLVQGHTINNNINFTCTNQIPAVIRPKYCRYGVKHYIINQSNESTYQIQDCLFIIFTQLNISFQLCCFVIFLTAAGLH